MFNTLIDEGALEKNSNQVSLNTFKQTGLGYDIKLHPVSHEIFAPVRKSPIAKGGDYFMHAEHEQFAPRRFIHDRRLRENRPSIVWL